MTRQITLAQHRMGPIRKPLCFGTRRPLLRDSHNGYAYNWCGECEHVGYCGFAWREDHMNPGRALAARNQPLYAALVSILWREP